MALFRATIKKSGSSNGIRYEKGMSVDFPSTHGQPLSTNGGKEVIAAFERVYGLDIKKAVINSSAHILIEKIGQRIQFKDIRETVLGLIIDYNNAIFYNIGLAFFGLEGPGV